MTAGEGRVAENFPYSSQMALGLGLRGGRQRFSFTGISVGWVSLKWIRRALSRGCSTDGSSNKLQRQPVGIPVSSPFPEKTDVGFLTEALPLGSLMGTSFMFVPGLCLEGLLLCLVGGLGQDSNPISDAAILCALGKSHLLCLGSTKWGQCPWEGCGAGSED